MKLRNLAAGISISAVLAVATFVSLPAPVATAQDPECSSCDSPSSSEDSAPRKPREHRSRVERQSERQPKPSPPVNVHLDPPVKPAAKPEPEVSPPPAYVPPPKQAPVTPQYTPPAALSEPEPEPEPAPAAPPAPKAAPVVMLLVLDRQSVQPGGAVNAHGEGCTPGSDVTLSAAGEQIGTGTANDAGVFDIPLASGALGVGSHRVEALCGPVLLAALDVVLVTQLGSATATLTMLVFFLIIGLVIYRRRLLPLVSTHV
ncbi:hypothetical protein [Antrihabitans stalactiti]|nr:hypothetical protein [Antrihabitans stalactiti]